MTLETAAGLLADPVTETQLREAFIDDTGRGDYLILSRGPQTYVQASGEGEGPYTLEYRDGDAAHHFEGGSAHCQEVIERVFLWYLAGDSRWQSEIDWQKLEPKSRWKLW
jgi:hypothetical protein